MFEQVLVTAGDMKKSSFSIQSLLLFVVIVALSLQLWRATQDLKALEEELSRLHAEVGHIEGTDPSRIQIVAIDTPEANRWRWRIRLPDDKEARLIAVRGEIPKDGFATVPEKAYSTLLGSRRLREFVLDVDLWEDTGGNSGLSLSYNYSTTTIMKLDEPLAVGLDPGKREETIAGASRTEEYPFNDRICLLRLRSPESKGESSEGLLLWLSDYQQKDSVQKAIEDVANAQ